MGICFYNGLDYEHPIENIIEELLDKDTDSQLKIRDLNINYCRACSSCSKTGKCILKDDGKLICDGFKDNHSIIFLTNLKYGGYSKTLKNAIDRLMPIGEPELAMKEGYMTHKIKYGRRKILFIAIGENLIEEEKRAFKELAFANYINFNLESYSILIFENEDRETMKNEIIKRLKEVK
ncbi:MAG: hypothetical protein ACRDD2_09465 [Sarcina sp.]